MVINQKRAVFIDRDGVIIDLKNYSTGGEMNFLSKKEDIKFIEGAEEAIKLLNKNNLEVIIVTNNPQVAKGLITEEEAISINEEIKRIFFEKGARIDGIYYCPHHPKGSVKEYSIKCDCRKPLPGLLLQAAREHNLNLNESYMIGDRISDIKAGNLAGCKKSIGVRTGYACNDGFKDAVPDVIVENIFEAAKLITKKKLKLFVNTGGEGKRLYPLTKDIPKPLVKVKNKSILHHLVDWARKYEIDEIIMMNGYKAEKIIKYFGDGSAFGIPIHHSNESFPLGSGGPLKYAKRHLEETSVYISGDLICEVDLKKMLEFHTKNKADITVFLHKSSHPNDSDILKINEDAQVIKFISKHDDHTNSGELGNAGLCIIEPRIFDLMQEGNFNFENYLYPKILEKGLKMMGYVSDEKIIDIGTLERLKEIEESNFKGVVAPISIQRKNISTIPSNKIIRSRAPSRIELGGSGTDLHTYFGKNGGFVINAAINKYSYASMQNFDEGIKINFENKSTFEFPNLKSIKYEGDLDLIKAIIKKLQIEDKEIFLRNDALSNSGLGTNASLAVATLGACYKLKNNQIDKNKIAEEAYQIASKELNIFGGKQNQFASSFGGINTIEFEKDGKIIVDPLRIDKNTLRELEKHLILVYVGKRVNTNEILKNQEQKASDTKQIEILDKIKENALNMKDNLERGDTIGFAESMEKEWILKKIFDPSSTTFYINHLYNIAKKNGAIGGRILGAGGGGHMLFYSKSNKEQLLTKKLQENGARIIDFGFDYEGLEVWETK